MPTYKPPWELVRKKGAPLDPLIETRGRARPGEAPPTQRPMSPETAFRQAAGPSLQHAAESLSAASPDIRALVDYWERPDAEPLPSVERLHALRKRLHTAACMLDEVLRLKRRQRWKLLRERVKAAWIVKFWRAARSLAALPLLMHGDVGSG